MKLLVAQISAMTLSISSNNTPSSSDGTLRPRPPIAGSRTARKGYAGTRPSAPQGARSRINSG